MFIIYNTISTFTGVGVSGIAMWSKKPMKTLEKPYVGAYSLS